MLAIFFCLIQFAFGYNVMIDPGHGGPDRGAVRNDYIESHIALAIANKLTLKLKATNGIEVVETRTLDKGVPLKDRVKNADRTNPDIFVSIHVNSSEDPRAKGVEFYFSPSELLISEQNNTADKLSENILNDYFFSRKLFQSKKLAKTIAESWQKISSTTMTRRRKLLQAPFYVVSKTKIPSILIELGFLSNPQEADLLKSNDHQEKLAEELYQGLLSYIRSQNSFSKLLTVKR
jgi:N-acetylmuramoyl-L-alanine amidase